MRKSRWRMGIEILALISFIVIGGAILWQGVLSSPVPSPPIGNGGLTEARHWTRLDGAAVLCQLCFRKCTIPDGARGFCRVRENKRGNLYSLVYGKPVGLQVDPIELEPMYHMFPGHRNLCVFTASCNFRCKQCHNWHISQRGPEELRAENYSPREVVEEAIRRGCKSISHSINEPTVFYEYMYDIAREARKRGLLNLFHTNGSISPEPLRQLLKYMDGVTVDLKGFTEEFYEEILSAQLEPVLKTLKIIKEEGVHMEIVNLIIPTLNDDPEEIRKMCEWIKENLGADIPLHFSRFMPAYRLTHLPATPVRTLEMAIEIAHDVGLNFVYIGNVPGHKYNSTFCPQCKKRLIHRTHFVVLDNNLKNGKCPSCKYEIPGIWK